MQQKAIEKLRELACKLAVLSAEMLSVFEDEARIEANFAEEVKKIPMAIYFTCHG